MRKTNLRAVTSDEPEQLSLEEIQRLAKALADDVCQDDDAIEILLLLAIQMQEHCYDGHYVSNIGEQLVQHLFNLTLGFSSAVIGHTEEYRQKLHASQKGGREDV
jgi:glutamyl-tRNA reductase